MIPFIESVQSSVELGACCLQAGTPSDGGPQNCKADVNRDGVFRTVAGCCVDGITEEDCLTIPLDNPQPGTTLRFFPDVACEDLRCITGEQFGACCFGEFTCRRDVQSECESGPIGRFMGEGSSCPDPLDNFCKPGPPPDVRTCDFRNPVDRLAPDQTIWSNADCVNAVFTLDSTTQPNSGYLDFITLTENRWAEEFSANPCAQGVSQLAVDAEGYATVAACSRTMQGNDGSLRQSAISFVIAQVGDDPVNSSDLRLGGRMIEGYAYFVGAVRTPVTTEIELRSSPWYKIVKV